MISHQDAISGIMIHRQSGNRTRYTEQKAKVGHVRMEIVSLCESCTERFMRLISDFLQMLRNNPRAYFILEATAFIACSLHFRALYGLENEAYYLTLRWREEKVIGYSRVISFRGSAWWFSPARFEYRGLKWLRLAARLEDFSIAHERLLFAASARR